MSNETARQITEVECIRCGHHWWPRSQSRPKKCAACGDPKWDQERIRKVRSKAKTR